MSSIIIDFVAIMMGIIVSIALTLLVLAIVIRLVFWLLRPIWKR